MAAAERIATADDYLTYVIPRLYMPWPAFAGYSSTSTRVYPLCALIRYLIANASSGEASISLDEVFSKIIANGCIGTEQSDFYRTLTDRPYTPARDEPRQVRELMLFLAQYSPLKWNSRKLFLDVSDDPEHLLGQLLGIATPRQKEREGNPALEVLELGASKSASIDTLIVEEKAFAGDEIFIEGKRVWVYHLRVERSRKLRQLFFAGLKQPYRCDLCSLIPTALYPWTENILELHHLLPLSSPIRVELAGTQLEDLVGLCPSCHRAVHAFYAVWLKANELDDFLGKKIAKDAYDAAKKQIAA